MAIAGTAAPLALPAPMARSIKAALKNGRAGIMDENEFLARLPPVLRDRARTEACRVAPPANRRRQFREPFGRGADRSARPRDE